MKNTKSKAASINSYLNAKGSPLAGYGKVFVSAGRKYGVDPYLLVAIAGAESGFGKFGSNVKNFNAWGWGPHQKFGSWDDGIYAVARGLGRNYIGKGLRTIQSISGKYAPVGAANDPTNLNVNWVKTVSKFYREAGGTQYLSNQDYRTRRTANSRVAPNLPDSLSSNEFGRLPSVNASLQTLSDIASGKFDAVESTTRFMSALQQDKQFKESIMNQSYSPPTTTASGEVLVAPMKWKGTHTTSNLGWGKNTASDIMASAGTPVGAPEDGTIIRHGSAQGGQSLYFKGKSGKIYWLGHIDDMAPVGTDVMRGEVIAYISADHKNPHLHIDVK